MMHNTLESPAMSEQGATARPWRFRPHTIDDNGHATGSIFAMPRDGHAYAIAMCPRYQSAETWNADAALIATAVNDRDALLAQVKYLREALGIVMKALDAFERNASGDEFPDFEDWRAKATAALNSTGAA